MRGTKGKCAGGCPVLHLHNTEASYGDPTVRVGSRSRKVISTIDIKEKYPPSEPCSCDICLNYCRRPGWWTVEEATRALEAGYADRMMLEMSPELTFGVLSPAFKGNEGNFALQIFADKGCTFLKDNLCELFGTGVQPLECRFCHHTRRGSGEECHSDIEKDWCTPAGQQLVIRWGKSTGFFKRQGLILNKKQ